MVGLLLSSFIAQQHSVRASFRLTVLSIAKVVPLEASGVMTLSPRDAGTCSHEHD
jgi:hypothetical protein